jgi:hypothetical protein
VLFSGRLKLPISQTEDFFRGRLDQMIDLRHPLAVLSTHMPWQEIEASLAGVIACKVKAGRKVEDIDLFGPVVKVSGGGVSNAGAISCVCHRRLFSLSIRKIQTFPVS